MMKAKVITLGCKVNQYESEAMLSSLLQHGFAAAEDKETADVVILNSCTVTAESDRKVRQIFRRAKKDNPDAVMVLTGCMAQAFPEDARRLEEADIILGTSNRKRLVPDLLAFFLHASASSTLRRTRTTKNLRISMWRTLQAARVHL